MNNYDAGSALIRAARFTKTEAGLIALGSIAVLGIFNLNISGFIDSIVFTPASFLAVVLLYLLMHTGLVVVLVTIFASAEKSACPNKTLWHHFSWTIALNLLVIVIWHFVQPLF